PAREEPGFLYGRGACDAKGIIAAQITAAEQLRADGVGEIGLLFVVDEEMGSAGARAANAHPRAGECRWLIDGEPTDNRLAAGSKGSLRLSLRTEGVTAHSAYPGQGRSAIDPLLDVLAVVRRTRWPTDPFFGDTTLNIGVIAGGSRPNVVAGDARADLQIRLVTDAAPVRQLLERTVDGRARIEYLTAVNPVRLTTVPGFETCLVRFTTDIPHLANWGSPLLIGPGSILDAHTAHERISLEELAAGAGRRVRGGGGAPRRGHDRLAGPGGGGAAGGRRAGGSARLRCELLDRSQSVLSDRRTLGGAVPRARRVRPVHRGGAPRREAG